MILTIASSSSARPRRSASPALVVAGLTSVVAHAAFVAVVTFDPAARADNAGQPLVATLTVQAATPVPEPSSVAMQAVSPGAGVPAAEQPAARHVRAVPLAIAHSQAAARETTPASIAEGHAASVPAEPLVAMSRLGELLERQMSEFPAEIRSPPRVLGELRADYPLAALQQGIEGTVVAWVVIDEQANVEEIQFAEGPEVFHEAVADAIRKAQFYSAAEAGHGLRFPISLEFRFALAPKGAAGELQARN